MKKLIKTAALFLVKIPLYVFGFLFLISMMAYAIVECGLKNGTKKFDKFLDLTEEAVEGSKSEQKKEQ